MSESNKLFLPICVGIGAFVIGIFWAGYSITSNMERVAEAMAGKTNGVQIHMSKITESISDISKVMGSLAGDINDMNKHFEKTNILLQKMGDDVENIEDMKNVAVKMEASITKMTSSMQQIKGLNSSVSDISKDITNMNRSVYMMGRDINGMSRGFSTPINMMDKMPFPF